jgi:hypothetical protein
MSLNPWERQSLESIQETLARTDPSLERLLVTFTRIASDERMPGHEDIRAGLRRVICYPRSRQGSLIAGRIRRRIRQARHRLSIRWMTPLVWLVTTAVLLAVALVLNHGGAQQTCVEPWTAVCASPSSVHNSHTPSKPADANPGLWDGG